MSVKLACLIVSFVAAAAAQTPEEIFHRANDHYREGRYNQAADQYESLLRRGIVSAPLFFNLGNSYYRMGKHAEAILAYERALRLEPGDEDAVFNVKLARMRTVDRIEPVPELFLISWLRAAAGVVSLRTAAGILVIAWSLLFGSLALFQVLVWESWGRIVRWMVIGSLVLTIMSGGVLILQASQLGDRNEAVIMAPVVTVKTSPDAQSVDAFVIHSGLKVQVDDVVGEWTKILLADGKIGWVRSSTFERI